MLDDHDFGFYGKGLDGYMHYKQAFDDIHDSEPENDKAPDQSDISSDKNSKRLNFDKETVSTSSSDSSSNADSDADENDKWSGSEIFLFILMLLWKFIPFLLVLVFVTLAFR